MPRASSLPNLILPLLDLHSKTKLRLVSTSITPWPASKLLDLQDPLPYTFGSAVLNALTASMEVRHR